MGALYRRKNIAPSIIRNGNKIFMLKINRKKKVSPEIIFKDSFNFLSQRLDSLPKTLDLSVQPKLFFPHGFNRAENMHIYLDSLPDRNYYFPEQIGSAKKREEFDRFYTENQHNKFNLAEALKEYCGRLILHVQITYLTFKKMMF